MTPLQDLWSLEGRCAIVTGGAQGFGAAIARRLAEAGAIVALADIREAAAQATADRLAAETRGACFGHRVDVSDETSVSALFDAVESRVGPVDILVNNAGVFSNYLATEMAPGGVRPDHRRQRHGRLPVRAGRGPQHAIPRRGGHHQRCLG